MGELQQVLADQMEVEVHSIDSLRSCTQVTATNTMPCAMAPALLTTGIVRRQLVKPLFSMASLMPTPVSLSSSSASLLRLVPSKHSHEQGSCCSSQAGLHCFCDCVILTSLP